LFVHFKQMSSTTLAETMSENKRNITRAILFD